MASQELSGEDKEEFLKGEFEEAGVREKIPEEAVGGLDNEGRSFRNATDMRAHLKKIDYLPAGGGAAVPEISENIGIAERPSGEKEKDVSLKKKKAEEPEVNGI